MLQYLHAGEEMTNKVYEYSEQANSNILDQSFITMPIEREKKVAEVNAQFAALVSQMNFDELIVIGSNVSKAKSNLLTFP